MRIIPVLLVAGIFAGCAMISKFSAILVFPALFLIATFTDSWKKLSVRAMAVFLAVAALTIWAGYFFEVKPLLKNTPDPPKKIAFLHHIGGEPLVIGTKPPPAAGAHQTSPHATGSRPISAR